MTRGKNILLGIFLIFALLLCVGCGAVSPPPQEGNAAENLPEALAALGEGLPSEDAEALLRSFLALQQEDGGFSHIPRFDPYVALFDSYLGLYCLELMDVQVPEVQTAALKARLEQLDSSALFPGLADYEIDTLYYYVKLMQLLDMQPDGEIMAYGLETIAALQDPAGFFYPSVRSKEKDADAVKEHPSYPLSFSLKAGSLLAEFACDFDEAALLSWLEAQIGKYDLNHDLSAEGLSFVASYLQICETLDSTPPEWIMQALPGYLQNHLDLLDGWPERNNIADINIFHLHNLHLVTRFLSSGEGIAAIAEKLPHFTGAGVFTLFPAKVESEPVTILASVYGLEMAAAAGKPLDGYGTLAEDILSSFYYDGFLILSRKISSDIVESYFVGKTLSLLSAELPPEQEAAFQDYLAGMEEELLSEPSYMALMYLELRKLFGPELPRDEVHSLLSRQGEAYLEEQVFGWDLFEQLLFVEVCRQYDFPLNAEVREALLSAAAPPQETQGVPLYVKTLRKCQELQLLHGLGEPIEEAELRLLFADYLEAYSDLEEPLYCSYWLLSTAALLGEEEMIAELPPELRNDLLSRLEVCYDGYFYSYSPEQGTDTQATYYYIALENILKKGGTENETI